MSIKDELRNISHHITKMRVISFIAIVEALIIIVLLAPLASPFVDGLERVATDLGFIHLGEGTPVFQFSPFPDYGVPGLSAEDPLNVILSSILGMGIVFAIFGLITVIAVIWIRFVRPRYQTKEHSSS